MFGLMRNLYRWYISRNEKVVKFALIGIDNAGKSTILARIKGEVPEFITPTVGFASEQITQGKYHIKIFDLGGGANIRTIWPSYYAEIHGAIFVVDSADRSRLNVSRDALHAALQHPRLSKKPLLIFANKQDLPEAMQSHDVALQLALDKFSEYSYNIVDCTAILVGHDGAIDSNIQQGLKWLLDTVNKHFSSLERRITEQVAEQKEEERIEKEEKRKRIEAMRRERELERERQEKEEQEKNAQATEGNSVSTSPTTELAPKDHNSSTQPPPDHLPHPPSDKGISITIHEDKKDQSPSPHLPTPRAQTPRTTTPRTPRAFSFTPRNSIAPAPEPPPTENASRPATTTTTNISTNTNTNTNTTTPRSTSTTPRSAWDLPPTPSGSSKRKLEPLSLPHPT